MAWNGSGTFTRTNGTYTGATVWAQDEANGFDIEATRQDTHDQDLAAGINACLAKNGENAMTGDLNMGTFDVANATDGTFSGTVTAGAFSGPLTGNVTGDVTGTASNASQLNSQSASYYTNASNLASGTVPAARLTAATTSVAGIVQLSTSTSSTSTTLAATASAVKAAYDLAAAADGDNLATKTAKWTGSATSVNKASVTDFGIGLWAVNFSTSAWGFIYIPSTTQYCSTLIEGGYISYGYVLQLTFDGTNFTVTEKRVASASSSSYTLNGIYKVG